MTTFEALVGSSMTAFIWITVIILGFAAYMTGQAVANTWRPYWQLLVYCVLIAGAARFFSYALGDGQLLTLTGYLADFIVLAAIGSFAYQLNRARKMVSQYPWLYERAGLFGWRARH
ncbi:MAG: hypothetical protein H6905_07750 [Hyphomicrobiales bacterium]|nr:hypothetical protein [Hyphomicrobiales bacterium]